MMIKQPALAPSPQPRPAPTVRALPAELAAQRGPFWMPIRGPNPTPIDKWVARQITEAFPWDMAPGYMIRDRDRVYGTVVTRRLRAMGIRTSLLHRPHPGRTALPN